MARYEGDFRARAEELLSPDELLALIGKTAGNEGGAREDAIACYLSGSEGWREAMKLLGGTFAGEATKLKDRKAD